MQRCSDAGSVLGAPDGARSGLPARAPPSDPRCRGASQRTLRQKLCSPRARQAKRALRSGDVGNRVVGERQAGVHRPGLGTHGGLRCIARGAHRPRCSRMRRMTAGSSILLLASFPCLLSKSGSFIDLLLIYRSSGPKRMNVSLTSAGAGMPLGSEITWLELLDFFLILSPG